jgi:p-aminobenzoyl-glutamate transporter AbgT
MSESVIQKTVIVGGSLLIIMCFTLICVTEILDGTAEDLPEERVAFIISIVGIIVFSSILAAYGIHHIRKNSREVQESLDIEDESTVRKFYYFQKYKKILNLIKIVELKKSRDSKVFSNYDKKANCFRVKSRNYF